MLIDVRNLCVSFGGKPAVDGVSLSLAKGERLAQDRSTPSHLGGTGLNVNPSLKQIDRADSRPQSKPENGFDFKRPALAVVGESGSGKSTLARALLGLAERPAVVSAERFEIAGQDMRMASSKQWRRVRGRTIGLMLQDPRYCLNPVMSIGAQIAECRPDTSVAECLAEVELSPDIAKRYPHELSGGQGQRAYLAMVLALSPMLLVADEPTSALDPPLALQMKDLIERRILARNMALLLITHDIELAQGMAPQLLVMQDGKVVEEIKAGQAPSHPFTRRLFAAVPRLAC
ncbi:MAG: ABC transporter ATP-binding protein [Rhodospirillales bacterium]|nr:MAG: ABC transporter ATP-binding protein [Rhodospirillales bacterium]